MALVLAGMALTACATSAATVEQQPEAILYYPGSHVISGTTVPQNVFCIDDCHSADRQVILEIAASPDRVMAWYASTLQRRGWALGPYDSGINPISRSWQRNGGSPAGYSFGIQIGVQFLSPYFYQLPYRPGLTYYTMSFSVPDS
jgi:hypothetical protein